MKILVDVLALNLIFGNILTNVRIIEVEKNVIVRNLSSSLAGIPPSRRSKCAWTYRRAIINGDVTSGRSWGLICEINLR